MSKQNRHILYRPARILSSLLRFVPFGNSIWLARIFSCLKLYRSKHKITTQKWKIYHKKAVAKCRLYVGARADLPLVVYFHGGGFVYGGFNMADGALRDMCHQVGCNILAVKYPLAPKNKLPIAIDICSFVFDNLNINLTPNGVVLMGESAGCNIALNIANTQNSVAKLVGMILLYPFVDLITQEDSNKYPSLDKYAKGCALTKKMLIKMSKKYLPKGIDCQNPIASPIHAKLKGLPPTLIFACGFDPLYGQSLALNQKLVQSGTSTTLVEYSDITHGYFSVYKKYIQKTIEQINLLMKTENLL